MPGPDEPIIISDGSPLDISCKDTDHFHPHRKNRKKLVLQGREKVLTAYQGPTDAKPVAASGALSLTVGYDVNADGAAVAHRLTATTSADGKDFAIELDEELDHFHPEQHHAERKVHCFKHKHDVKITSIALAVGGVERPVPLKPQGPNPFAIWVKA
jgi:hypothetical protein